MHVTTSREGGARDLHVGSMDAETNVPSDSRRTRDEKQRQRRLSDELSADSPYDISRVGIEDTAGGAQLRAVLRAPQDSVYFGGEFALDIHVPPDYPFKPPRVKFSTNIFFPAREGAALESAGTVDLLEVKKHWSPALTLNSVLDIIYRSIDWKQRHLPEVGARLQRALLQAGLHDAARADGELDG